MNADFPRLITLLRKEKGISQKQAAGELGISQALLSHYEKGIRECGLDFLVRCSKFYDVSTDYLLGVSPDRKGQALTAENITDPDALDIVHFPDQHLAGGTGTNRGTGGMVTKLQAAKICMGCGCDMVIANGNNSTNLYDILEGKEIGTRFTEVQ